MIIAGNSLKGDIAGKERDSDCLKLRSPKDEHVELWLADGRVQKNRIQAVTEEEVACVKI
jgi:hypothetical protein